MSLKSILVIGATGRLGKCLIQAGVSHKSKPLMHAFARSPEKVTDEIKSQCASVVQGDATEVKDIERALEETKADYIVISLAVTHLKQQDVREKNANAIAEVIAKGTKFEHVKVVIISSVGAANTKIDVGFGWGTFVTFLLKNALADHTKQEEALMKLNSDDCQRVMVVRPTGLTDEKANGNIQMFEDNKRAPESKIDRGDVAMFVVEEICKDSEHFGMAINITGQH